MNTKHIFITTILAFSAGYCLAQDRSFKLEHTFDGYYSPWNMELFQEVNNKCFYEGIIQPNENSVKIKVYNEDYSIKDNINVSFNVPSGYKTSSCTYSPEFTLPDGNKFFIISFSRSDISDIGTPDYAIANAYDAKTGAFISTIASASGATLCTTSLFVINGKKSILVYENNIENGYKTLVYSLGEAINYTPAVPSESNMKPVPVITFDINGRIMDNPTPGVMTITKMSDGSTIKTIQ